LRAAEAGVRASGGVGVVGAGGVDAAAPPGAGVVVGTGSRGAGDAGAGRDTRGGDVGAAPDVQRGDSGGADAVGRTPAAVVLGTAADLADQALRAASG
jgi:hypothetical protein